MKYVFPAMSIAAFSFCIFTNNLTFPSSILILGLAGLYFIHMHLETKLIPDYSQIIKESNERHAKELEALKTSIKAQIEEVNSEMTKVSMTISRVPQQQARPQNKEKILF